MDAPQVPTLLDTVIWMGQYKPAFGGVFYLFSQRHRVSEVPPFIQTTISQS